LSPNFINRTIIRDYGKIATFAILVLISIHPVFLKFTERDLGYHMVVEHTLFFFVGVLSVQGAESILRILVSSNHYARSKLRRTFVLSWTRLLRGLFTIDRHGYIWIIIVVDLLVFWHLPWVFDFAQLHGLVHVAQHVSFILVGAMCFLAARSLGESFKIFGLLSLNGIMGFAGLMFSVLDKPIYLVYSVNSHNDAGYWMLIMCLVLLLIALPAYLIKRTLFYVRVKQISSVSSDHGVNG
jgi:cytochrome c oxidase assembly factor CtaG